MIHYDLICEKGHEFDGWFSDSSAFDKQALHGMVNCTVCGTGEIQKQLMAPGIPARSNTRAAASQVMTAGPLDPRAAVMMQMMREHRKHVEATSENVGDKFVDEARKIHYNESEKRGIHGLATPDDAKALVEEGIEIFPVPVLPEDGN